MFRMQQRLLPTEALVCSFTYRILICCTSHHAISTTQHACPTLWCIVYLFNGRSFRGAGTYVNNNRSN